jgi:hypothetical protein
MIPGLTRRTSPGALPFYAGVLLITSATLMLQVIQTRILSVVAWYHSAFFVISIAMFGLTAGAVWVYSRRERFTGETLSHDLAHFSVAFALTTMLAVIVQMCLSPITAPTVTAFATWSILAICLALPFFFSGITLRGTTWAWRSRPVTSSLRAAGASRP